MLHGPRPCPQCSGLGFAPVRATSVRVQVALVQATSVRVLPPCRVLRVAVRLCARVVARVVAAVSCDPLKGRMSPSPRRASPSRTARGVIVLSSAAGLFLGHVGHIHRPIVCMHVRCSVFSQQPAHARLFGSSHRLAWTQSARRLRETAVGRRARAPRTHGPSLVLCRVWLVVAVAPGLIVSRFCPLSW